MERATVETLGRYFFQTKRHRLAVFEDLHCFGQWGLVVATDGNISRHILNHRHLVVSQVYGYQCGITAASLFIANHIGEFIASAIG